MDNRNEQLKSEAMRILKASEEAGIPVRLLGGMAVYTVSPCTRVSPFARTINDLDFVVSKKKSYPFGKLLETIGFEGDHEFNSIHGESRMLFRSDLLEIDVFVGLFEQCHQMNLEKSIPATKQIIPLADLLLTKLQIVQINQKDILDILALLHDHEVAESGDPEQIISLPALTEVLGGDWGWYTTVTDNLEKINAFIREKFQGAEQETLLGRTGKIAEAAQNCPKSLKWKLRSKVGRKVQWYNLPEEK